MSRSSGLFDHAGYLLPEINNLHYFVRAGWSFIATLSSWLIMGTNKDNQCCTHSAYILYTRAAAHLPSLHWPLYLPFILGLLEVQTCFSSSCPELIVYEPEGSLPSSICSSGFCQAPDWKSVPLA